MKNLAYVNFWQKSEAVSQVPLLQELENWELLNGKWKIFYFLYHLKNPVVPPCSRNDEILVSWHLIILSNTFWQNFSWKFFWKMKNPIYLLSSGKPTHLGCLNMMHIVWIEGNMIEGNKCKIGSFVASFDNERRCLLIVHSLSFKEIFWPLRQIRRMFYQHGAAIEVNCLPWIWVKIFAKL